VPPDDPASRRGAPECGAMSATEDELRRALRLLETAIQEHEARLKATTGGTGSPIYAEVQRTLGLMRQEAERLRRLVTKL
jgi:hypothetical protein